MFLRRQRKTAEAPAPPVLEETLRPTEADGQAHHEAMGHRGHFLVLTRQDYESFRDCPAPSCARWREAIG